MGTNGCTIWLPSFSSPCHQQGYNLKHERHGGEFGLLDGITDCLFSPFRLTVTTLQSLPGDTFKHERQPLSLMWPQPPDEHCVNYDGVPRCSKGGGPQYQGLNTLRQGLNHLEQLSRRCVMFDLFYTYIPQTTQTVRPPETVRPLTLTDGLVSGSGSISMGLTTGRKSWKGLLCPHGMNVLRARSIFFRAFDNIKQSVFSIALNWQQLAHLRDYW